MIAQAQPNQPADQYDSPWKEALEEYFPECMALLFPKIHADIDWSRGYEFLDKELEKVVRQALVTEQHVDKLVKLYRLSGDETWVLLHIDVQSQHETDFAARMYQYNYRLFDRYNQPVVTLVIYGDESRTWRPDVYQRQLWDFRIEMQFPSVKLIAYDLAEMEQSDNPFAIVVMAHRYTKETKHHPDERYSFKWRLTRMLYERGYKREQILSLFRYIDWMMALPPLLEQQLDETITEYEEEHKMTFMIYRERKGYERGLQEGLEQGVEQGLEQGLKQGVEQGVQHGLKQGVEQGIQRGLVQGELQNARENVLEVLQIRFGELPQLLVKTIKRLDDLALLKTLHRTAITVESITLFEQFVADNLPDGNTDTPTVNR